jgi:hypothetical protein
LSAAIWLSGISPDLLPKRVGKKIRIRPVARSVRPPLHYELKVLLAVGSSACKYQLLLNRPWEVAIVPPRTVTGLAGITMKAWQTVIPVFILASRLAAMAQEYMPFAPYGAIIKSN